MIPRIKSIKTMDNYILYVVFDDGKAVFYDVKEDIQTIPSYQDLVNIYGLFQQVQLDASRTCVYWNDWIDLPSDTIYEYGTEPQTVELIPQKSPLSNATPQSETHRTY